MKSKQPIVSAPTVATPIISKLSLLAALKPVITEVDIVGFGMVNIKQLTVAETDDIRKAGKDKEGADSEFGLRMLVGCVVDDMGQALFTEADLPDLRNSGGAKVDALVLATVKANNIGQADAKNSTS
jgi:hypothetical protein